MIYDFDSLVDKILVIFISFFIYAFFYKKYYTSLYDPLFYNIVIYLSFSSALMFLINGDNIYYMIEFILFQISFFLGFLFTNNFKLIYQIEEKIVLSKNSIKKLSTTMIIVFIILLLVNLMIYQTTGFAIFSEDPTMAKVANFTDGGGIYRRLLWTLTPLCIAGSVILILSKYKRKLFVIFVVILLLLSILSGSKGSLLVYVFYVFILSNHKIFKTTFMAQKIQKTLPLLLLLAVFTALLVLTIETNGIESAIYHLINRLLFNGDVVIYYYIPMIHNYFSDYDFFTYIYNIFNGVLGMLRIVPYETPTGYQMVYEFNNGNLPFDMVLGPNTPVYIVSDMYFGPILGIFYSFFVGSFIAFSRQLFLQKQSNAISFLIKTWLYMASFTFMVEAPLFIGRLFEIFLFFMPIVFIVTLLYYSSRKKNVVTV